MFEWLSRCSTAVRGGLEASMDGDHEWDMGRLFIIVQNSVVSERWVKVMLRGPEKHPEFFDAMKMGMSKRGAIDM